MLFFCSHMTVHTDTYFCQHGNKLQLKEKLYKTIFMSSTYLTVLKIILCSLVTLNTHRNFGHDFQKTDLVIWTCVMCFSLLVKGCLGSFRASNLRKISNVRFVLALEY